MGNLDYIQLGVKMDKVLVLISDVNNKNIITDVLPYDKYEFEIRSFDKEVIKNNNYDYCCVVFDCNIDDEYNISNEYDDAIWKLVCQVKSLLIYNSPIIVIANFDDVFLAVKLIRAGAYDYIPKSKLTNEILYHSIKNAIEIQNEKNTFFDFEYIKEIQKRCRERINEYDKQAFFKQINYS